MKKSHLQFLNLGSATGAEAKNITLKLSKVIVCLCFGKGHGFHSDE